MRIFLISPVRGITEEEKIKIGEYVKKLEDEGHSVHWPIRDTNQNDTNGIRICRDNMQAISNSEEVHVWFNPTSSGSLFDLGMVFAMWNIFKGPESKSIRFANKEDFPDDLHRKSFIKVLKWLDSNT